LLLPKGMPHSHSDNLHEDSAREKRELELRAFDRTALETAYEVICDAPATDETRQIAADTMVAEILDREFGPIP
jgi:hypothetical protein